MSTEPPLNFNNRWDTAPPPQPCPTMLYSLAIAGRAAREALKRLEAILATNGGLERLHQRAATLQ